MGEARDPWGKAEVIIGAVSALGSIAIPLALFIVGNRLSEHQQEASAKQLEADRVERMLGHLTSDKPDEKKLAVRVLEFFVAEKQFPGELLPAIVEIASSDSHQDVADTASEVLQKVAAQTGDAQAASAAQRGLAGLPPRLNVEAAPQGDKSATAAVVGLDHADVVVATAQPAAGDAPPPPPTTELRYFRKEDAASAQQMAGRLAARGIKAELRDLSQSVGLRAIRPRSFDLVIGQDRRRDRKPSASEP
jgi:hypothetical protein